MFGKDSIKLKGNRCGTLKKRESEGRLIAVTIDEFNTSRVCSSCHNETLKPIEHAHGNNILECKFYINASKNMMEMTLSNWRQTGRPTAFQRPKKSQQ
ncbi:uncharacterized protein BX663DRAFT_491131 [Cokeromyces recurvatus]|uniref:uncharacterized protein n=1 Tax=Cokeromyces recurvatus TaxID=90255 RepID=UPI002220959B|nr:uncharacterized protein BX663DRAFT_491131 [Cokeromyces recurvatus]KAI7907510.1 hypothetical protein BX663DRAFT_491131 [Cokeromyces recurvatus]